MIIKVYCKIIINVIFVVVIVIIDSVSHIKRREEKSNNINNILQKCITYKEQRTKFKYNISNMRTYMDNNNLQLL